MMIYLDHNATTPTDPAVLESMTPYFTEAFANPASRQHAAGRAVAEAIEVAAHQVACLIKADDARQIVWTSGATESNNLAIRGAALWVRHHTQRNHLVTTSVEHKAVLDVMDGLEMEGFEVTRVDPGPEGLVEASAVAEAITDKTALVSVMWANNETGMVNPIASIGSICRDRGVWLHTDATQAVGKVPVNVEAAFVDLLSCSSHKMYGPKGVGALFVRRRDPRVRLQPQILGGGHQRNMRSGTLNTPGIVGFGHAAELCRRQMLEEAGRLSQLRNRLEAGLVERAGAKLNVTAEPRLPHCTNVSFEGIDADRLIAAVPEIACSHGSACTTNSLEAGYVLRRMGLSDERVRSSLRFGLGRWTDDAQIGRTIELFAEAATALRSGEAPPDLACVPRDPAES
jgi:cysteine desulfurase